MILILNLSLPTAHLTLQLRWKHWFTTLETLLQLLEVIWDCFSDSLALDASGKLLIIFKLGTDKINIFLTVVLFLFKGGSPGLVVMGGDS